MAVPSVGLIIAVAFPARVGEIGRFEDPRQLVGYLGPDPKVRQSGSSQATMGRISKEGSALVRHVLVESAHTAIRSPDPLRAFFERVRARRGHAVAIVAVARKVCVLVGDQALELRVLSLELLQRFTSSAPSSRRTALASGDRSARRLPGPCRAPGRRSPRPSAYLPLAAS
jgi:hypothetical protein